MSFDIEFLLDKAQTLKGRENQVRWELAEIAYQIVGSRIPGATMQLALVCGLTAPDAVEHWAKAWRLYRVMKRYFMWEIADIYRNEFSVSHFYTAWELGHKHKMSVKDIGGCFFDLLVHKNKGERWSVDVLKAEINADYPDGKAISWRWHWKRVTNDNLKALLSFDGELPLVVKAWVRMGLGLKGRIK